MWGRDWEGSGLRRRGARRCGKLSALQGWAGKAPPWQWLGGRLSLVPGV